MTNFSWTATYGEVKSASEWTELGDNDRALQDGTGIGDDTILSRHLDVISTTDANGWKIFSFGSLIINTKRVTFSQTINTGPTALTVSSTNIPVALANLGSASSFLYSYTATGNAGALVIVDEGSTAATGVGFVATSTDSSRSYTGYIDMTFIV